MHHRGVPPDDEVEQRQLPPKLDTGRDEAHQGEGGGSGDLRTDAGGRIDVLRIGGGEQPGGLQTADGRHHREPL